MADGEAHGSGPSELALRTTVGQLEGYRERSLELFGAAHDALTEAHKFASMSFPSATKPMEFDREARSKSREKYVEEHRQEIDRRIWNHLVDYFGLEPLMDHQARTEFRRSLTENPPPATSENLFATFLDLIGDAGLIFRRGLSNAFSRLDRRFRSHDGFKIGSRIILSHAFGCFGGWSRDRDETLRDIERVFRVLDGQPQIERYAGSIVGRVNSYTARPFTVEDDYFKLVAYKNGNAHLWFKRDDLVRQVNKLLAEYYGESLGEGSDVAEPKHAPKTGIARNYAFFETPVKLAEEIIETAQIERGMSVLEPSAGLGRLAIPAKRAGGVVTCVEVHRSRASALLSAGVGEVMCEDFMGIDPGYVKKRFDRIVMNPPFDDGRDVDHVMHALDFLKPDGVLVAIMSASAEFRESKKHDAFRARVAKLGGKFIDLPPASFKESGTYVNTCKLVIGRKGWF